METIYKLSSFVLGNLILLHKIQQATSDANCTVPFVSDSIPWFDQNKNFGVVFFSVHGCGVVNVH